MDWVSECPGAEQDREGPPHQCFTLGCPGRPTTTQGQLPRHVRVSGGLYRPRTDRTPADDRSQREANRMSERAGIKSGGSLPKRLEPLPGSLHAEMKRCGKPGCRCARGHLHGPYVYRRWWQGHRQRKQYVPQHRLKDVEAAIRRWRDLHPPAWRIRQDLVELRQLEQGVLTWMRT